MSSPEALRALLALLLLVAAPAAQVTGVTRIVPQGPQFGFPDPDDPARYVWVFLGGVQVEQGPRSARGDSLVAVLRRDTAAPAVPPAAGAALVPDARILELFLDGHVEVVEGDERLSGASAWHLDNRTGISTMVEGELHAPRGAGRPPLAARYRSLRRLQDGTLRIEGFRYTNCAFGRPHWHVETPWAELRTTPEGRILETGGNVMRWGELPFFWLPGFRANLDQEGGGLLLRRLGFGSSSRFGSELLVELGADASDLATGVAGLFGADVAVDARWSVTAARYGKRGLFLEPKLKYETADSRGEVFAAHIHDTADEDHLDRPIEDASRGRVDLVHRTRLDARRTLDIEVSRQSDANFLQEYYEREFREDKPQESYVSYRDVLDTHATTVLARARLNEFDTQAEYLPEVVDRLLAEPVLGGFLSNRAFLSNARLRPAEDLPDDSVENLRVGDDLRLDWAFDLPGGDRLHAQAGADLTFFEDTVADGGELRTAAAAGVEWVRAFHGTDPDAASAAWNIDGLRRLSELRVGWFDRFHVSERPEELLQIDAVERLDELRTVLVGWRDRLQTRGDGRVHTLLDVDLALPVYPHDGRDNGDDTFGPLLTDVRWEPRADFVALRDAVFHWRSEQDLNDGHYLESFASFSTGLGSGRRLLLASSTVFHEFDFRTVALTWQFTPRWLAAVFVQDDRRVEDRVRQGLVLRQKIHCWYLDLELSTRRGDSATGDSTDETRVTLALTPADADDPDLAERIAGRYF